MQFKNKNQQAAVMSKYNSGVHKPNDINSGIHEPNNTDKPNLPQRKTEQEKKQEDILERIKDVKNVIEQKDIEWKDKSNTSVIRTKAYKDKVRAKRKLAELGREYDINFHSNSRYIRKY